MRKRCLDGIDVFYTSPLQQGRYRESAETGSIPPSMAPAPMTLTRSALLRTSAGVIAGR